jgi:hypothetical protein
MDQLNNSSFWRLFHKLVQDTISSTTLLDLLCLDVQAPPTVEQVSMAADDLATAADEKKNPMAHQLLMRLEKTDIAGVKLFADVSLSWNKTDYIAMVAEAWKDKGCFAAANAAAYLY